MGLSGELRSQSSIILYIHSGILDKFSNEQILRTQQSEPSANGLYRSDIVKFRYLVCKVDYMVDLATFGHKLIPNLMTADMQPRQ